MEMPIRSFRTVKIRTPNDYNAVESSNGHHVNSSQNGDVANIKEALVQLCNKEISMNLTKPHLGSILNTISKQIEKKGFESLGLDLLDFFICMRITLINENKSIRAAGLRVIRICILDKNSVQLFVKANLHHFVAKCFDVIVDNLAERAQALRLCRKLLLIDPCSFPLALGRSLVALALDGYGKEKDRLFRASLALLAELCIVNPSTFVSSGGVRCLSSAVLDCCSSRMQEAMVASLLYLLDTEERRCLSTINLRFLIAPYSDFHYRHYIDTTDNHNLNATNEDRDLRLVCAKQALLTVLRSWGGLLHVISCKILDDLVRVLLPCQLETRKAMLDFFYTLLRLPLPDWTDEFSVALQATDPSRVHDAWKLQEGYVACEGKSLLPHVSKYRPNLVLNHTALLVYCLVESKLVQTLVEVIVTSDTFISVRATILLGELLHLSSTLLPPVCHGTKMCLPKLVDHITSLKSEPVKRHRASQAAAALAKIHQLKKNGIVPHSLALKQIIELERKDCNQKKSSLDHTQQGTEVANGNRDPSEPRLNGELECEVRSTRDPDGILFSLTRDCGVLVQKDPLMWNWNVLSNLFLWSKMNLYPLEDSSLRCIVRRVIQFYKPSVNQFCQCEFTNSRTRLYSTVGCLLMDFLTATEELECEKILAEFLDDVSTVIRDITVVSSAHDCLFSPGRMASSACQDYFLFIGRLSSTANGVNALEKAGIFQDLLELVAGTNHDCYLKVIVSMLDYHTDGYSRAILKKVLIGAVESARIYATNQLRVLLRAAATENTSTTAMAKWAVPLLLNQLKDKCRAVVMAAADILDEATDDPAVIEVLIQMQPQFVQIIQQQESQFLDSRGTLLLIKTLSIPAGFKLWLEAEVEGAKVSLIKLELDRWMSHLNTRYVQLVESDLADGLSHHQRADDGRYGRLSNVRHAIRDLPVPPHLFSQLNQHREGLDFLRTSGQLSKLFTLVTTGVTGTEEEVLQLKAAVWAAAHLGTSEAGVLLLESAQVVEALVLIASHSPILALRGTAFFALNLVAMTTTGVNLLARFGWASIKRHHGELWHVVDDSEWNCFSGQNQLGAPCQYPLQDGNNRLDVGERDRRRTISQSSSYSVTFAGDDLGDSDVLTSTPRRLTASGSGPGASHWETDSQPYSLEGSSVHFDSDSDHSAVLPSGGSGSEGDRTCRRAYTLPPSSHTPGQDYVAQRSFSDSHYLPADELPSGLPTSSSGQPKRETRIWTKLRMSLRLRTSKRSFLPNRSSTPPPSFSPTPPIQLIHIEPPPLGTCSADDTLSPVEDSESSEDDEGNHTPPPLHFDYQFNRIGSILNRLKSVQYKKRRPLNPSGCYIGLSLPVQLSNLYPPPEWFEPQVDASVTTLTFLTIPANEQMQYEHATDQCILCSVDHPVQPNPNKSEEEQWLVRKELLRLVGNMGSSIGMNANEQGLLRLKQRFPWAFHDVCLYSDVCNILTSYGYRLRARRFLQELFMDSPFDELYTMATSRLAAE